ncbi:serine/arginine-rich SC35-like splicing factor SCL28 isoform X3 [Cryptomeria japonica]|uniref:serine/arginine-rich SC35-like splicing factor SCL28 isoform X3 n=1 Tax=Cryptomeria japonica TaxID=3369 RepID=UPI0025AC503B|nr:serine/arginine-rich SC35-like splicing factor SCL28 isoform X3 [Cryptomeria japonica]
MSSSRSNRNPKLKRRTPSPPPRRERGKKYSEDDNNASNSASTPRYTAYPTTLLVRNLSQDTRPEDLRIPFESFGPMNDVYLPKNYHTGKPTGFGFVKYRNAEDAAEAKHHMNNQIICGHQISVVFSKEDAKRPEQMLAKEHDS